MYKALNEIIMNVPYNSAANMLKQSGVQIPKWLGGSCIVQNRELTKLLEPTCQVKYLKAPIGWGNYHYMTIAYQSKSLFMLDPFLSHSEPVDLKFAYASQKNVSSKSYPRNGAKHSSVNVRFTSGTNFMLKHFVPSTRGMKRIRTYKYNLDNLLDDLPKDLTTSNLPVIRFIRANGDVTSISYEKSGFLIWINKGSGEREYVTGAQVSNELDKLVDEKSGDKIEILDFFKQACSIFLDLDFFQGLNNLSISFLWNLLHHIEITSLELFQMSFQLR